MTSMIYKDDIPKGREKSLQQQTRSSRRRRKRTPHLLIPSLGTLQKPPYQNPPRRPLAPQKKSGHRDAPKEEENSGNQSFHNPFPT